MTERGRTKSWFGSAFGISMAAAISTALLAFAVAGPAAGQSQRVRAPVRPPDIALHCQSEGKHAGATQAFYIWVSERVCGFADGSASYPCNIGDLNFNWGTEIVGTRGMFTRYNIDRVNGRMHSSHGDIFIQWQCSKVTPQTKKF